MPGFFESINNGSRKAELRPIQDGFSELNITGLDCKRLEAQPYGQSQSVKSRSFENTTDDVLSFGSRGFGKSSMSRPNDGSPTQNDPHSSQRGVYEQSNYDNFGAEIPRALRKNLSYSLVRDVTNEENCFDSPNSPQQSCSERKIPEVLSRDVGHAAASTLRNATEEERLKRRKREKYMFLKKTDVELFDLQAQIQRGSHFDELCGNAGAECEVHVSGAGSHPPFINGFEDCNFTPSMLENMKLIGIEKPTQIQKFVIPLILGYKTGDILAHAQTGSGKTASFMLPIIHKIMRLKSKAENVTANAPYAVIIAPTKELCRQLCEDAQRFSNNTGVTACMSFGEIHMQLNLKELRNGCDIFVATITRACHFVYEKIITLKNTRFLVMDEVDSLIKPTDVNYDALVSIKSNSDINRKHRTFMFSATQTAEVLDVLGTFINLPSAFLVHVGELNRAVHTVKQTFIPASTYEKRPILLKMLEDYALKKKKLPNGEMKYDVERTIIFVARKQSSERLAHELAWHGYKVIDINGDRTLHQRVDAIEKFSKGIYEILVSTDIASRGMNFPRIAHVINFDLPTKENVSYIHRLGRSGRAGNVGRATSFFNTDVDKDFVEFYIKMLQLSKQHVPQFMLDIADNKQQEIENQFIQFQCLN